MAEMDNDILRDLNDLNRLRKLLNISELARLTGEHRGTLKRWWDEGDDMMSTLKRDRTREIIIEIVEEINIETSKILGRPVIGDRPYKHLDDEK